MFLFEFTNKIMEKVYQLFYDTELPRISEEMMNKMQLSTYPTDDWFFFKNHIIIKIYGFTEAPYIFPAFQTSKVFAIEYIRKRLFTEKEQILKDKNGCNIKFHYVVGPFVIKSSLALPLVEKMLESMKFQKAQKANFDPGKIIAERQRQQKYPIMKQHKWKLMLHLPEK